MELAYLLRQLEPLCKAPLDNLDAITDLLERGHDLAEFEVARFRVASALRDQIEPMLRDPDPRARLRAIKAVHVTYPRTEAGRVLRTVVKDPDARARARARHAVRDLGIDDVALPDTRYEVPGWVRRVTATTLGAWNPTGWAFGTMRYTAWPSTRENVLDSHGLPVLTTPAQVARLVGLRRQADLSRFTRPGSGTGSPYVDFDIPKRTGGTRRISAPRPALQRIQQAILREILARLPVGDACHGFVTGRSTVTNAAPHVGAHVVIKTDLRDFFPTIHYRRVRGLFQHYGYSHAISGLLASLTTHRPRLDDGFVAWPGILPQGAPTSPAISNLICRRLDARLSRLAARFDATYTRYADDLTFSFADQPSFSLGRFFWWVDQVCQQEGFTENPSKRRVLRAHNQQRVTGIVVNHDVRIPRQARRRFRAILANCRKHGVASQARSRENFADYLRGFASYVKMVQPELGERWTAEVEDILSASGQHSDAGES